MQLRLARIESGLKVGGNFSDTNQVTGYRLVRECLSQLVRYPLIHR
jgi:hypothetical protein